MALDSLYNAWQKAHYPYEFYEVMLQHYSDKGNKDKVALIKKEMSEAFGIKEGEYKFGKDNRQFLADKENKCIYPSLVSIKGFSQSCANDLYKVSQSKKYNNFLDLYLDMLKEKSINKSKIEVLIKLGYFSDFGKSKTLLNFVSIIDKLSKSQFNKEKISDYVDYIKYIKKYCEETEKQYRKFDSYNALQEIYKSLKQEDISIKDKLDTELEKFGFIRTRLTTLKPEYCYVQGYECKFKNPKLTLYHMCNGDVETVKIKRATYDENPINQGDIIKIIEMKGEGVWYTDGVKENGDPNWKQDKTNKEQILKKYAFVK